MCLLSSSRRAKASAAVRVTKASRRLQDGDWPGNYDYAEAPETGLLLIGEFLHLMPP